MILEDKDRANNKAKQRKSKIDLILGYRRNLDGGATVEDGLVASQIKGIKG